MKKLLLVIIVLIGAAVPAVPYVIGMQVEEMIRSEHAAVNKQFSQSATPVSLEIVEYQRGWLESTGKSRLVAQVDGNSDDMNVEINFTIKHMPDLGNKTLASIDSAMTLSNLPNDEIGNLLRDKALINASTLLMFDGSSSTSLFGTDIEFPVNEADSQGRVNWKGLKGKIDYTSTDQTMAFDIQLLGMSGQEQKQRTTYPEMSLGETMGESAGEGELPEASEPMTEGEEMVPAAPEPVVETVNTTFELSPITYKGKMSKGAHDMWFGNAELDLNQFKLESQVNNLITNLFSIEGIKMTGSQEEAGEVMHVLMSVNAQSARFVDGETKMNYGPMQFDLQMRNLHMASMKQLEELTNSAMAPDANPMEAQMQVMALLPQLLGAKPEFHVSKLEADTPEGQFSAKASITTTGEWNDMMAQNPMMMAGLFKANLEAHLPRPFLEKTLAEQAETALVRQEMMSETPSSAEDIKARALNISQQQIGEMITAGYLTDESERLGLNLEYTQEGILMNGKDATPLMGIVMGGGL